MSCACCACCCARVVALQEPNVKYLALETLARLALVPDILEAIRHHQATVVASLKVRHSLHSGAPRPSSAGAEDASLLFPSLSSPPSPAVQDADVSIRKRSMDLLFTMCDASCAEELVKEMLGYLVVADFSIREELVLKVAILAEKFAPTVQWCEHAPSPACPPSRRWSVRQLPAPSRLRLRLRVPASVSPTLLPPTSLPTLPHCRLRRRYVDVALELLEKAGDFVSEEVWHRVVQLVTNNPAMQQYAARNVVATLKRGATHEVCAPFAPSLPPSQSPTSQ